MSRHHAATHHSRDRGRVRAVIAAQLPMPCVECGHPVTAGQTWHVAHIHPAMGGGRTTVDNCGPAHARCNLVAGGRMGAAVVNTTRRSDQGIRPW
jgi:5-methylcytosine-specific restriction endonuclease McrA